MKRSDPMTDADKADAAMFHELRKRNPTQVTRRPFTYSASVYLARRDTAERQSVQMGDTIFAEDAEEAMEVAIFEVFESAAKHFAAWKVIGHKVHRVTPASDGAWS